MNLIYTSLGTQGGDSGCPVVYSYNSSYSMVEIVTGGNTSTTLVCQIQKINSFFDSSVSQ